MPKTLKKKFVQKLYRIYDKSAFRFNFGTQEVPQLEIMHFNLHVFYGWIISQGPNVNLKQIFS